MTNDRHCISKCFFDTRVFATVYAMWASRGGDNDHFIVIRDGNKAIECWSAVDCCLVSSTTAEYKTVADLLTASVSQQQLAGAVAAVATGDATRVALDAPIERPLNGRAIQPGATLADVIAAGRSTAGALSFVAKEAKWQLAEWLVELDRLRGVVQNITKIVEKARL
jgi:hypothetical protein